MRPLYGNQNTRFDLIDDCFRLRLVADFLPQFPADAADELAHTNFAVMPNEVERAVRADVEQVPAVLAACTAITG